jgi:hypothetical protein
MKQKYLSVSNCLHYYLMRVRGINGGVVGFVLMGPFLSVRHEILTAVRIKVMVFGNIKQCTFVDTYRSFLGTWCLNLLGVN